MRRFSGFAPNLDSLVRLDMLQEESPKSIKKAWSRFHQKLDCISSVLDGSSYDKLLLRTKESPMFVFPIPTRSENSFRSILFQARGNVHLYTDLEAYKKAGEKAPIALCCTFFNELQS